jgi:excisionase family DNA binding protein
MKDALPWRWIEGLGPTRTLTVKEAVSYFNGRVTANSLYRWARAGKIPSVKMGRKVLFRQADLAALGNPPRIAQDTRKVVKLARESMRRNKPPGGGTGAVFRDGRWHEG